MMHLLNIIISIQVILINILNILSIQKEAKYYKELKNDGNHNIPFGNKLKLLIYLLKLVLIKIY